MPISWPLIPSVTRVAVYDNKFADGNANRLPSLALSSYFHYVHGAR
jgi:hypothetical protein